MILGLSMLAVVAGLAIFAHARTAPRRGNEFTAPWDDGGFDPYPPSEANWPALHEQDEAA